jgi:hypothetical protein
LQAEGDGTDAELALDLAQDPVQHGFGNLGLVEDLAGAVEEVEGLVASLQVAGLLRDPLLQGTVDLRQALGHEVEG